MAPSSIIFPPPFFPASARIRVEQHGKGSRNRFQEQTEGSRNRAKKLRSGKMMKDPDDPVSKMKDQWKSSNLLVSLLYAASPPFAEHLPHHSLTRSHGSQNSGTWETIMASLTLWFGRVATCVTSRSLFFHWSRADWHRSSPQRTVWPATRKKFKADQDVLNDVTDLCVAHLRVQKQKQGAGTWNVVFDGHHPLDTQSCQTLGLRLR